MENANSEGWETGLESKRPMQEDGMLPKSLEDALQDPSIRRRQSGEVLLTMNTLVLLQALRDFPDAWAPTTRLWVRRAMIYRRQTGGGAESTLLTSARQVPSVLVARKKMGPYQAAALAPLGAALLDRVVPVWLLGRGAYTGFRALTSRRRG
jgi:hypothetical protein